MGSKSMTTRRDFVKSAGTTLVAGLVGLPITGWAPAHVPSDSSASSPLPNAGKTSSAVASNGYLSSLLPWPDRLALRKINIRMTRLAVQQCLSEEVANQIVFDTLICEALASFAAHDVSSEDLIALSRDYDVVF